MSRNMRAGSKRLGKVFLVPMLRWEISSSLVPPNAGVYRIMFMLMLSETRNIHCYTK